MLAAFAHGGCVLADPPSTLPAVPPTAPGIESQEPGSLVLAAWPTRFAITVNVVDPTVILYWEAFEDYTEGATNPVLPSGRPAEWKPEGDAGQTRTLLISNLDSPVGPGCHTVTIVVANSFTDHVPDPPGGVYADWIYSPGGDCTSYDAGPLADGSFPDSAAGDAHGAAGR